MHEFLFSHDARYANRPPAQPTLTLFALGLWIRLGFIGTSAFVAAVVSLISADPHVGTALAVATAGGLLASLAWSRVHHALHTEESAPQIGPRAPVNS